MDLPNVAVCDADCVSRFQYSLIGVGLAHMADGTEMRYEARARNAAGPGTSVSLSVPTPPAPPGNVTAVVEDGQATLSWEEPVRNGGASITGYQYRYGAAAPAWAHGRLWMERRA